MHSVEFLDAPYFIVGSQIREHDLDLLPRDEILNAITKILSNYDFHSSEARRIFKDKLDFELSWPSLFT
jgi:hypothetical protein